MEASELIAEAFWKSRNVRVLAPPHLRQDGARLERELEGEEGVVFATSGSSGLPKWVLIRRAALLASAEAVSKHLSLSDCDRLMLPLPLYHVGGFGMAARAYVVGCDLRVSSGGWDPMCFVGELQTHRSTITSLVPAQVHDLVSGRIEAPPSLRAVVVGGGALGETEGQAACDLGWPLLQSYGMTEAASQVATDDLEHANGRFRASPLPVLPHWEFRLGPQDRLELRGEALFEFYVRWDGDALVREERRDREEWFRSSDVVELDGSLLAVRGRVDRQVKILGEMVDLQAVEDELQSHLEGGEVRVLPLPDDRRGWRLQPVVGRAAAGSGKLDDLITIFNRRVPGYARLEEALLVDHFPRTALGKIDDAALRDRVVPPRQ